MSPVFFLHGFLGAGADWRPVQQLLGLPSLALDLPGHGAAVGLDAEAYTLPGAAAHVIAALDAAGLDRCHLLGYSMGGRLALYVALRYPDRVETLVLESASPGLRSDAERGARRVLDAERAAALTADLPGFLKRWYRMPLFASLPPNLRARWTAERAANDPAELGRSLHGMGTGAQPSLWNDLPRLRVPSLLVTGAHDAKFAAVAEAMKALNPALERAIIPDAGHVPHAEQPSTFAATVRAFIGVGGKAAR